MSLKDDLHNKFINIIYHAANEMGWTWVDLLIDVLCYIEVNLKLLKNKQLRDDLYTGDVSPGPDHESLNMKKIPKDTLYCSDCPFLTTSKIAKLFYGEQMSGYCYYLNQGDFTFGHPTDLLWDGCKCCGIHDDIDEVEFEYIED